MVVGAARIRGIAGWLNRGGVPVVNTAADLRRERSIYSVFSDNDSLAALAAEHFQQLRRKEFAFIGYRHSDGSRDRAKALMARLAEDRLPLQVFETESCFTGTFADFASLAEVEPQLVKFLKKGRKPLAVMALNDRFAASICRIVQDLGLAIPDDVAVLGVGDLNVARLATPPISSIRTNVEQIGYEAARLVHGLIEGQVPRRTVEVPAAELVVRESTVKKRRAVVTDIESAREYIRQNACDGLRVEDVAGYVHVPLRTFEIEFAAAVGHTVGEEIRGVRLERAKALLASSNSPLARVAKAMGFTDGANLNRFFQRWAGMTATEYRRKRRQA